jgi:hypothetical protein
LELELMCLFQKLDPFKYLFSEMLSALEHIL